MREAEVVCFGRWWSQIDLHLRELSWFSNWLVSYRQDSPEFGAVSPAGVHTAELDSSSRSGSARFCEVFPSSVLHGSSWLRRKGTVDRGEGICQNRRHGHLHQGQSLEEMRLLLHSLFFSLYGHCHTIFLKLGTVNLLCLFLCNTILKLRLNSVFMTSVRILPLHGHFLLHAI
jgi:hypothetical protein